MSDEDYEPGVIAPFEEIDSKKKGSVWKGIGIGILVTLVLELIVAATMDPQLNLVHRYLAYLFGLLVLLVVALITKSTLKMFFVGTPVVIIASFVFPFFLPDTFSGLMAPFVTLIPILEEISDALNALNTDTSDLDDLLAYSQYGFVLDLVIAMFVGTLASLGISGLIKVFTHKPGILTIFTFTFSMIFFMLGVIILPYIIVITSGVAHFGLAFGTGALNMSKGMELVSDGDLDGADVFFNEASIWFDQGAQMLDGLETMQLFELLGTAAPDFKVIVDNGLIIVNAAVDLVQAAVPMFKGVSAITGGIDTSMTVLNEGTNSTGLFLTELTDAKLAEFEEGIEEMKIGFAHLTDAFPEIRSALQRMSSLDKDALNQALSDQGLGDTSEDLDMIDGAVNLFDATLNVFEILITEPTDGSHEAPFIHLMRGALSMSLVGEKIGGSTSFEGTSALFQQLVGNLTIVVDTFDLPEFAEFDKTDVGTSSDIQDLRDDIQGAFRFIKDAGNIAIGVGEFGIVAAPALQGMNDTMSILTAPGKNFTTVTPGEYDEAIANLDDVIVNATLMKLHGENVSSMIGNMSLNAANETYYGLMSDGATEFVTLFEEFDLATDGANFLYLALGFQSLMRTSKELQVVDGLINNIKTDIGDIEIAAAANISGDVIYEANNVIANITETNNTLEIANDHIGNAIGNFSLIQNMTQMDNSKASLESISVHINNIQGPQGLTKIDDTITFIQNNPFVFIAGFQTYIDDLNDAVNYITNELELVQSDLTGVSIADQ